MRTLIAEERSAAIVTRQHGMVSRSQLGALEIPNATVANWIRDGYLTRVIPRVYAVGHAALSREAELWAAVLYAGPGAALSHASAAHHRGLIMHAPEVIHVSTPRGKVRSLPGRVHVHGGRDLVRSAHEGIPTTTIAQTVLDLAASESLKVVRRALSVLDYRKQLDLPALDAICGRGRPGSRRLREALAIHRPELAYTNGELEVAFLHLCERFGLPVPRFNVWMHGFPVDAYWPDHGLVVEVDGRDNHSSPAQLRADRRKELVLRAAGLRVVRYDWSLVRCAAEEVYADLVGQGLRA